MAPGSIGASGVAAVTGTRLCPSSPRLSRVDFLGEMRGLLHSRALLPLIPPTPFSHKGRRGSLVVLMHETGDETQGRACLRIPADLPAPIRSKGESGRPDA
jgi:hypothetical protein